MVVRGGPHGSVLWPYYFEINEPIEMSKFILFFESSIFSYMW